MATPDAGGLVSPNTSATSVFHDTKDDKIDIKLEEGRLVIGPIGVTNRCDPNWRPPDDWYDDEDDDDAPFGSKNRPGGAPAGAPFPRGGFSSRGRGSPLQSWGDRDSRPIFPAGGEGQRPPLLQPPVDDGGQMLGRFGPEYRREAGGARGRGTEGPRDAFGRPILPPPGRRDPFFDERGGRRSPIDGGPPSRGGPFDPPEEDGYYRGRRDGSPFFGDQGSRGPRPPRRGEDEGPPFFSGDRGRMGRGRNDPYWDEDRSRMGRDDPRAPPVGFNGRDRGRDVDPHDRRGPGRRPRDDDFDRPSSPSERSYDRDSRRAESRQEKPAPKEPPVPEGKVVTVEDLVAVPGRFLRPPKLTVVLRGLPGSGKSTVAKKIKDMEVENGGSAPRILCLDDYFMVESERLEVERDTGRKFKTKVMEYEYDEKSEERYRDSLIRSYKKQVDDGFFPFIILDCIHEKISHFSKVLAYSKQHGFEVYVCEVEAGSAAECHERSTHKRPLQHVLSMAQRWEPTPPHLQRLVISTQHRPQREEVVVEEDTQKGIGGVGGLVASFVKRTTKPDATTSTKPTTTTTTTITSTTAVAGKPGAPAKKEEDQKAALEAKPSKAPAGEGREDPKKEGGPAAPGNDEEDEDSSDAYKQMGS